jgi:hypothetical protein
MPTRDFALFFCDRKLFRTKIFRPRRRSPMTNPYLSLLNRTGASAETHWRQALEIRNQRVNFQTAASLLELHSTKKARTPSLASALGNFNR